MILPQRWMGEIGIIDDRGQFQLQPSRLIRQLLLFEKVVIYSHLLREFDPLIKAFGFDSVIELLRSGAVSVFAHAFTIGSTGQTTALDSRLRKGLLPLHSYSFSSVVGGRTRKEYVGQAFEESIRSLDGLSHRQERVLVREIASRLIDPRPDVVPITMEQLRVDLDSNATNIKVALAVELGRRYPSAPAPSIQVFRIDDADYRVETNLVELTRCTEKESHEIAERALLAVGGVNQRLAEMKCYEALTNFWYKDIPILDAKLAYLQSLGAPEHADERLGKVLELPFLPNLDDAIEAGTFDLSRFLEVRSGDDAKAFRAWLHTADSAEVNRLEEHSRQLRARLGRLIGSTAGKTVRLLATTAFGLAPGMTVPSVAMGVVDTFLVERMFGKKSTPLAFLMGRYSSVFREPPKTGTRL